MPVGEHSVVLSEEDSVRRRSCDLTLSFAARMVNLLYIQYESKKSTCLVEACGIFHLAFQAGHAIDTCDKILNARQRVNDVCRWLLFVSKSPLSVVVSPSIETKHATINNVKSF